MVSTFRTRGNRTLRLQISLKSVAPLNLQRSNLMKGDLSSSNIPSRYFIIDMSSDHSRKKTFDECGVGVERVPDSISISTEVLESGPEGDNLFSRFLLEIFVTRLHCIDGDG